MLAPFERITRGDAQAAGSFIVETKTTAPGFGLVHYTLLNSFHEDTRICTTNWHAYALGWGVEGTHQDAVAEMALLEIDFEIGGVPVSSDTTAIKANTFYGDPLILAGVTGP